MSIDAVSQPAESNPSVQENRTPDLFNQTHFDFAPETSSDTADNTPAQSLAADIWRDAQNDSEADWTGSGDEIKLAAFSGAGVRGLADVLQLQDNSENGMVHQVAGRSDLVSAIKSSVGRSDLGNRVPANAREFANYRVPEHLQCASSISDLLISQGLMRPQDYKIRVRDLNPVLARMYPTTQLNGNFDIKDFPPGSRGFISGTDSSNHVGYFERSGDSVFIIHNKDGKMVREDIKDKFYTSSGRPKYGNMKIFRMK